MFKKNNRYKLLKVFFENSLESFGLRELGRLSGISPASVLNYLKEFEKEGFVERYGKRGVPLYRAKRDNKDFILHKKLSGLYGLEDSGLVDFLWEELCPKAIILYGSYAKGESIESSDIDIFILGNEIKISLSKFEKKLGREIHLMFENDSKKIPKELKNNLINGVVLRGYFNAL